MWKTPDRFWAQISPFTDILPSETAETHCTAVDLPLFRKPYKNSICIDVDHGFIRRYAITPANIHDSQMLPRLLDLENEHDYVWADSAYSGECFEDLLSLGRFESLIHEKGARNHPLSGAAKVLNRVKSAIRACVEHVFGCMTMSMGGKLTWKIGLARNEA